MSLTVTGVVPITAWPGGTPGMRVFFSVPPPGSGEVEVCGGAPTWWCVFFSP